MATQYEIGIIGAGNAAEGIVHGIIRNTLLLNERIVVSDPLEDRRLIFAQRFGIAVTEVNRYVVENSSIVIFAVKPQQFLEVCTPLAASIRESHLLVTIMAGVSTAAIEGLYPNVRARVVRVMPNLPMHVGAGMAGIHPGRHATEADRLHAQRIFEAAGKSLLVEDESLMDAVTAVSGSGPAYFYYFVEALAAAGEKAGLSPPQALILARQACFGAAKMLMETGDSPAVLRRKITSPDGTTQAAIESMIRTGVFEDIQEAVLAAASRSRELGRQRSNVGGL
jgi:pyrroline-5-carboxylate reductase